MKLTEQYLLDKLPLSVIRQILQDQEAVTHIREWIKVMDTEPPKDLMELQEIKSSVRRMLGDD